MKKVMFVVLVLLVATAAFALESGPSNKVGYTKITCGANGYTPFGLAFKTWQVPTGGVPTYGTAGYKAADIIGDQSGCGTLSAADRVLRQGGSFGYRSCANVWSGNLETNNEMRPSGAFWYWNRTASPRDIVIAGEADVSTAPDSSIVAPGYKPYSWRDPRTRSFLNVGLIADGFTCGTLSTSDRVLRQGGSFGYCTGASAPHTWAGTETQAQPGSAYWIWNRHATTWTYTYDPTLSAESTDPTGPTQLNARTDVLKVSTPKAVTKATSATN